MPHPLENDANQYSAEHPNDAMQLLTHKHRTLTITLLATHHTLTIDELAELIEANTDEKTQRDIAIQLRQIHIPMLTTADVVENHDDTITGGTHLERLNSAYTAFTSKL